MLFRRYKVESKTDSGRQNSLPVIIVTAAAMHLFRTLFPSLAVARLAIAQVTWTATPFNPASVPLAVRTPYLSCWLPQNAGTALNEVWPTFWTGTVRL